MARGERRWRVPHDERCVRCGGVFVAKSDGAKVCPHCRRAKAADYAVDPYARTAQKLAKSRHAAKMAALAAIDAEYVRVFGNPCAAPRVESPALRRIVEGRTIAPFCGRVAI